MAETIVGAMVDVARAGHVLIVSDGPGALRRSLTLGSPVLSVAALLLIDRLCASAEHTISPVALRWAWGAAALVGMGLLSRTWQTTVQRFDRAAGTLLITKRGPVRRKVEHRVSLNSVSALVDRRSERARAIELLLADGSTLVVARTAPDSTALDIVARELGDLLDKPVRLAEGTLLERRFELERVVDQSGMGVVYRALDRRTGRPVALKVSRIEGETGPQRQRFLRETGLLATLDHPRIVGHVSHGEARDGSAYLAMPWLDGEDLRATLTRGPLPLDDCLAMLRGAAEALAELHAHGVVHRGLEPARLFFRDRSAALLTLLDFGVARRIDSATSLTGSRSVLGAPHYMAPEQASGAVELGPAADVFSLGTILYECLTGKRPFAAKQLPGVLARIVFDRPEAAQSLRPGIPEAWSSLLARMLAKEPGERPPDGAALLHELASLPSAAAHSPAPSEEAASDTLASALPLVPHGDDDADHVLVSVVLVTAESQGLAAHGEAARFLRVCSALSHLGCPIARLADGSLLARVEARPSTPDPVSIAARCALCLRELLPEARISVATGRAPRRGAPVGDTVDRAVVLQEAVLEQDAVRLDARSAALLEARFVVAERASSTLLLTERPVLDTSRPLLGKPTPCVGRELELVQLEALVVSAIEDGAPRAALVLGAPGVGKSRLRHELLRRVRERYPRVVQLVGSGDPLHAGSPYATLGALLRGHAGLRGGETDAEARTAIVEQLCRHVDAVQRARVSEFLGELCAVPFSGVDNPQLQAARGDHRVMSQQISAAFEDWLCAEAAAQPVIVVLEDVQWVDALTRKLLTLALHRHAELRLCALGFGRPELESAQLVSGQLSISLGPLRDRASEALVREVLGPSLETEAVRRIVRLSAGNALFLEALIRATAEGVAGDVPDTVLAMLQARLSRLTLEQRSLLRWASVFGQRFWLGGVTHVSARSSDLATPETWLESLVDAELVVREDVSHLPGEVEYSFCHALVCDAAYALLSATDRQAAHAAVGLWLEGHGELDSVVLARHAEAALERERAMLFYARAAEHSLAQHDFGEALARAQKGVACGAFGQSLGILEHVQCAAFYSMGRWMDAAALGLRALTLLERGSATWCSTVERLMHVLPSVGRLEQSRALSAELLEVVPQPGARAAYTHALYAQLLAYTFAGAHARSRETLDCIARLGPEGLERDVAARGSASLWRAVYAFVLTTDMEHALSLSQRAIVDLTDSQVLYRLSFAHTVQSFIYWGLGEQELSERAARTGRALARRIHDGYHDALAAFGLGLALCEQGGPDKLAEAEQCLWELSRWADNPVFDGTSRNGAARAALLRGDFGAAESLGREARDDLPSMTPFALLASSSLLGALAAQSRWAEARELARQDLARLEALEGPVFSELLFRAAACDVLLGAGHEAEAAHVLADAHREFALRASQIADARLRSTYTDRPENRRIVQLVGEPPPARQHG